MVVLAQRVSEASVTVEGSVTGAIGAGLLLLVGIHLKDTQREVAWMAGKCARLRIFPDAEDRMNLSLLDTGGDALAVSQFTLYGNVQKGNRPAFIEAAPPEHASRLYDAFVSELSTLLQRPVQTGVFGAAMEVRLCNDGPVTIWIERKPGT